MRNDLPLEGLYPTFELHPERGILPNIYLPSNYEELIPKFYEQGRKNDIEDYVKGITELSKDLFKLLGEPKIDLNWDNKLGLTNISLGTHPGYDLNESLPFPHFQEHNLGMHNSIIAGAIAQKYVSELIKSE